MGCLRRQIPVCVCVCVSVCLSVCLSVSPGVCAFLPQDYGVMDYGRPVLCVHVHMLTHICTLTDAYTPHTHTNTHRHTLAQLSLTEASGAVWPEIVYVFICLFRF